MGNIIEESNDKGRECMARTMLDYLKTYGDVPFEQKPFGEVDSLILCQFAYLKFDGIVPGVYENKPSVSMEDLFVHPDHEKLFQNTWFVKKNKELFAKMYESRRFHNLRMNCYINIIESEWETQFSAITFILEDGTIYVAYRGTDETIVGWKEDFNMSFLTPVPGQSFSVKYLNMVVGRLPLPFYIGGHSKGGNLAVYAAMNCQKELQERIIQVYNMDGPGFRPEVLELCNFDSIEEKVVKIIPHSSVVGLVFEQSDRYKIVKSKALGLLQHDTFSWIVKYGRFVDAGPLFQGHKFANDTMNEWILSLEEEKRRVFVDAVYQVITAAEKDNLIDLSADWMKSLGSVVGALREMDEPTTNALKEVIKAYVVITQMRLKDEISHGQKRLKHKIKQKKEHTKKVKQD